MSDVVVIEDNEDIRLTTIEFLEMEGFTAVGCMNGLVAIDYLRAPETIAPKLIIVDLTMPVMDGPAFIAEQVADEKLKLIPVIVVSADGRIDSRCQALGVEKFLSKPVDLDELLAVVQKYVRREAGL